MSSFSSTDGVRPTRPVRGPFDATLFERLVQYFNVIYALIMHDIKNRFFGSGLGQIVMVLWPLVHVIVLIGIYVVLKRPNPYGTSLLQYATVSLFPFICCSYTARWITFSAMTNRSFLQYPIIKPLDIIVARALLEVVSITLVGIMLIVMLICFGVDPMPADRGQAVYAVCATLFFAIAFGVPNAVITFILPIWNVVVTLLIIVSYAASGTVFVASQMPEQFRVPLSYNPVLQCTEWFRAAYYSDYPTTVLDRTYLLAFSLVSLTIGLLMERMLRRFF